MIHKNVCVSSIYTELPTPSGNQSHGLLDIRYQDLHSFSRARYLTKIQRSCRLGSASWSLVKSSHFFMDNSVSLLFHPFPYCDQCFCMFCFLASHGPSMMAKSSISTSYGSMFSSFKHSYSTWVTSQLTATITTVIHNYILYLSISGQIITTSLFSLTVDDG